MKKSLYLLVFLFLSILMSSCFIDLSDNKDWFCICNEVSSNTETSRFIIPDASEKNATKECNKSDMLTLGVMSIDCELE